MELRSYMAKWLRSYVFYERYPVVSPTSRFANVSFANVLGRFANVSSRPKGQFANV